MGRVVALLAALVTSACCTSLPPLRTAKRLPLPLHERKYAVETESLLWTDAAREREIPAKIYSPAGAPFPRPLVIISHGIGEDRDTYEYLGRALAEAGFVAVHLTHAGTDRAVLEKGYLNLYRQVKNGENWRNRPIDVTFAIDRMLERPEIDRDRIAAAGHSAGAFTSFAVAGMKTASGQALKDPRVKAIIPMSMPLLGSVVPPDGYDAIDIPVLNVTGTCDTSIIYRTFPRHRRIPFDSSRAPRQFLVTIDKVNHDTFSAVSDPNHPLLTRLTIAFLRAWLDGDAAAKAWFHETGTGVESGTRLTVEKRQD